MTNIKKIKLKFKVLNLKEYCPNCKQTIFNYATKKYYIIDFDDNTVYTDDLDDIIQCANCKTIIYQ